MDIVLLPPDSKENIMINNISVKLELGKELTKKEQEFYDMNYDHDWI